MLLGREAHSAEEALRIADQRLYAQKLLSLRPPASREWRDVLLGLLRERDPELDTHVHEVAALARGLGERLGLAAADLADLVAAAELHDIGKAAIPDAILDKPEALDRDERAFIERHTIIGERIIASAPSLRGIATIVRATHERYDGRGYPDGLSGEQIPLAARIIAICDAYQAMTSNRGYWDAITERQARAELQRCAGESVRPADHARVSRLRAVRAGLRRGAESGPRAGGAVRSRAPSSGARHGTPSRASEPRRRSKPAGGTPRPAR